MRFAYYTIVTEWGIKKLIQKMNVITGSKIKFVIQNVLEPYYDVVMKELIQTGMSEELREKYVGDILAKLYKEAIYANVDAPGELERMAVAIINRELERILVPFYMKESFGINPGMPIDGAKQRTIYRILNQTPTPVKRPEPVQKPEPVKTPEPEPELEIEYMKPTVVRRTVEPEIKTHKVNWLLVVLLSILLTLIVWTGIGLLMGHDIIPRLDMGYTWFNSHIWNLF